MNNMSLSPIGVVVSPVSDMVDVGWGRIESRIRIDESFVAGLRGLDQFSHALIVFWMHEAKFDAAAHLSRHPQDRLDLPLLGIFAQRAKHRPNPIGITAVELLSMTTNELIVRGLDAIDGTPVLDIKPYIPSFDRVASPRVGDWISDLYAEYF